jgi:transmembrane sensor
MTRPRRPDEAEVRRMAEASTWRVRLAEVDLESSTEFEAWMTSDALNAQAWARVQAPWAAMGDAAAAPDVMAARREALDRARRARRRRWSGSRALVFGGLAAGVAACAVGAVVVTGAWSPARDYKTTLGERRVIILSDGSRVSLDSSSEVRVRYLKGARRLELEKGQARFDVAHDVMRPFTVHAGEETVVATGTAFNVDLLGSKVTVTLIQGRVTVINDKRAPALLAPSRGAAPRIAAPVVLTAGQELVTSGAAPAHVMAVSVDRATAWEAGQLVFEDESLASVAASVSRYSAHPVLVDPSAANLRMSGVFNEGDVTTFVDAVTHYLPVQARDAPDGAITLQRKG